MNRRVLRRFIILCAIGTVGMFTIWTVTTMIINEEPGDYYTREGDIRLGDKKYQEAIEAFNKALAEKPNHRGAVMGRALAFIQMGKNKEAVAELTHLIKFLEKNLEPDDSTGRGSLAAAYANRGILKDRQEKYKAAFDDYVMALKTDQGILDGPTLFDKILYGTSKPSTIRDRAVYIHKQLQLPPEKRLLKVPEIDQKQRMYKP